LVNNAGQYQTDNPERVNMDDLQYQFTHNAASAALVTRRFLPLIREQEQSLIVNICSVGSYEGLANSVGYAMGKHAVLGYTRSLREFLKGTNVAVTALSPGSTWSTSWEGSKADPNDTIDATDLAILIETLTRLSPRSVVEEMTVAPK
jgi:short-subunit dehydrogenase